MADDSPWRLLCHGPGDGAWNMAVDEAMTGAVGRGESPPTLRLYAWQRPTLSLGCLQPAAADIDLAACHRLAIPLVRRPTGGRAVLHHQELTYSVALPLAAWGDVRTVRDRFRAIAGALMAGLGHLGVETHLATPDARADGGPAMRGACFLVRCMPAILSGGRKLVGSAERRWERAVLQHGSLLLGFDAALHHQVFPGWQAPEQQVTWLGALLGRVPPFAELAMALCHGFSDALGAHCAPGALAPAEAEAATALVAARYGTAAWTLGR
jgi:lipoate-protein ligase A